MIIKKKAVKKYQQGGDVKGTVKGEMTGKSYPKSEMDNWQKQQAAALTKQAASQKSLSKKKMGGSVKKTKTSKCKYGCH